MLRALSPDRIRASPFVFMIWCRSIVCPLSPAGFKVFAGSCTLTIRFRQPLGILSSSTICTIRGITTVLSPKSISSPTLSAGMLLPSAMAPMSMSSQNAALWSTELFAHKSIPRGRIFMGRIAGRPSWNLLRFCEVPHWIPPPLQMSPPAHCPLWTAGSP